MIRVVAPIAAPFSATTTRRRRRRRQNKPTTLPSPTPTTVVVLLLLLLLLLAIRQQQPTTAVVPSLIRRRMETLVDATAATTNRRLRWPMRTRTIPDLATKTAEISTGVRFSVCRRHRGSMCLAPRTRAPTAVHPIPICAIQTLRIRLYLLLDLQNS